MKNQALQLQNDSNLTELINNLDRNEITVFLSDDKNIIHKKYISEAVLLFTYALNKLDQIPSSDERESHVLTGDYYFSEFYSVLARHGEMTVVHDMVVISKSLSSRKSKQFEQAKVLSDEELKYLLFAPLLYLIDNGYVNSNLNIAIDSYIKNMNISDLTYITNIKGES